MMRSLFAGVTGLKTHQTKMDVIGNNIANVNTTAYKSMNVNFSELMYQTAQRASGANAATGVGGTNARQIGLGVKSAAISTAIESQGAAQTTNNPFDIMITGETFFVVNNGSENFFTRDGSFYIDGAGNLAMTSTGYNLMGWGLDPANPGELKKDSMTALRIMDESMMTYEAEATSKARITGIVDEKDPDMSSRSGQPMNLEFYDNKGYKYTAKMSIHTISAGNGEYYVKLNDILDSATGKSILGPDFEAAFGGQAAGQSINCSEGYAMKKGSATAHASTPNTHVTLSDGEATPNIWHAENKDGAGNLKTITYASLGASEKQFMEDVYGITGTSGVEEFTIDDTGALTVTKKTVQNAVLLNFNAGTGKFTSVDGDPNGMMNLVFGGTSPSLSGFSDITIDFSALTSGNNSGKTTATATRGDKDKAGEGRKLGELIDLAIQKDGQIFATYDNGMRRLLGQIAVAQFANASGLMKAGDNLYSATTNSGEFDGAGKDILESGGYMSTGVLEMSNVDLSSEFTHMITTQRGFQANSRIITVSDTLLEELTNLKR